MDKKIRERGLGDLWTDRDHWRLDIGRPRRTLWPDFIILMYVWLYSSLEEMAMRMFIDIMKEEGVIFRLSLTQCLNFICILIVFFKDSYTQITQSWEHYVSYVTIHWCRSWPHIAPGCKSYVSECLRLRYGISRCVAYTVTVAPSVSTVRANWPANTY